MDSFGIRAGGSYWVKDTVEIFLGAGYDGNAVPDKTMDPSLIDMHKMTVALGTRVEFLKKKMAIRATYTQVIYFDRTVATRQAGAPVTLMAPSRGPDFGGTYTQSIGLLALSMEYLFF